MAVAALIGASTSMLAPVEAGADPGTCQRAIARETARLSQAELAALQACAQDRLKSLIPAATNCATDTTVVAARDKARAKLVRGIAKACGGANKRCGAGDVGGDADEALAAIGWNVGVCPGFEGAACSNAIADCNDIATCLACVSTAAVTQAVDLYGGDIVALEHSAESRCQLAIDREAGRFFTARSKALARCEDAVVRGTIAGSCPGADPKAGAAIARAAAKKQAAICKACGGDDKACGGSADLSPTAVGFAPNCPAVGLGPTSCGGAVATLDDLVTCADCVTTFKTDCLDALGVLGEKSYPAGCAILPTPTPTTTATPTRTPTPTPTVTPPAGPAAIKCERAIVKEAGRLARTRAKELARCEADKQSGKLPADGDCLVVGTAGAKITKAERHLADQVGRACGGADRHCGAGDTGASADLALGEIGWGSSACPGFENAGCVGPINDCGDVVSCVTCVHAAAVDQGIALAFAPASPADPGTSEGKCQLAIGRASAALLSARSTALQKCADATLKRRTAGPCPDPGDGKAGAAITKAEDKLIASICAACGGDDRLCGGGDDLVPSVLGFPATCPAVDGPHGACGGSIVTLGDLVQCLGCVTGFKNDCIDAIAIPGLRGYAEGCRPGGSPTPTPATTPTAPTPTATPQGVCGNGQTEPGEDCDDGNTVGCDGCPSSCKLAPTACPTVGRFVQSLQLQRTDAQPLTSSLFCLEYPVGTLAFPGSGQIPARISGFTGQTSLSDFNDAARVALLGQQLLNPMSLNVSFDLCVGAAAPTPDQYSCQVISASASGTSVDPALVTCTAVAP